MIRVGKGLVKFSPLSSHSLVAGEGGELTGMTVHCYSHDMSWHTVTVGTRLGVTLQWNRKKLQKTNLKTRQSRVA